LRQDDIRYLVIDRRLSTALPHVGTYVEYGEQDTFRHTRPIDPAALAKYDGMPRVSRVLDSGDIAVYDVGALANAP
jgi:hypothetical protein